MRDQPTEVVLATSVLDAIRHHALEQPHREVCGVLLGAWGPPPTITYAMRGTNVLNATDRYLLDAPTLLAADDRASRLGSSIVGFYHSHPNHVAIPSLSDRHSAWAGYLYLIVSVGAVHPPYSCAWSIDSALRIHPLPLAGAYHSPYVPD